MSNTNAPAANTPPGDFTSYVQKLTASAIPFIVAPTGTMANNGAVTLGTALPAIYPACYLYLPAGAIAAGSAAGWYFAVMSSATVGVVYNNVYVPGSVANGAIVSSGVPNVPGNQVAFVTTGPGAFTGVITAQAAQVLAVPANYFGPTGSLRYSVDFTVNNSAGNKTLSAAFGATTYATTVVTTVNTLSIKRALRNRGLTNSQVSDGGLAGTGTGTTATAMIYGTTDTTQPQLFTITVTDAVATDFSIVEGYSLEVIS